MTTTVSGSPETRFLTVAEAADELHVTERFIRKLIANGDLDAVRIGTRVVRIRRSDLDGLLRPMHGGRPRYRHWPGTEPLRRRLGAARQVPRRRPDGSGKLPAPSGERLTRLHERAGRPRRASSGV